MVHLLMASMEFLSCALHSSERSWDGQELKSDIDETLEKLQCSRPTSVTNFEEAC